MDQGKSETMAGPPPSYVPGAGIPTSNMPTSYTESNPPTYIQPAVGGTGIDQNYIASFSGILTVIEGLLGFLVFICAASDGNFVHWHGGGWLIFVGLVSFVCNVGLYLMYLFQYSRSLPASVNMPIAEILYCGVGAVLFFTCGVVASVRWQQSAAVRASAMFSWFALVAYTVDTGTKFRVWYEDNSRGLPATVTVTHTPTSNITTDQHY